MDIEPTDCDICGKVKYSKCISKGRDFIAICGDCCNEISSEISEHILSIPSMIKKEKKRA